MAAKGGIMIRKFLILIGCLFVSSNLFAMDIFDATCPEKVYTLGRAYWEEMVKGPGRGDKILGIDTSCYVIKPPISYQEFQNLESLKKVLTLYPDVIVPWSVEGTMIVSVHGTSNAEARTVTFLEIFTITKPVIS